MPRRCALGNRRYHVVMVIFSAALGASMRVPTKQSRPRAVLRRWGGPVLAGWSALALATAQPTDARAQPAASAMPSLSKAEHALQDAAEKLVIQAAKKLGQTPPRVDVRLVRAGTVLLQRHQAPGPIPNRLVQEVLWQHQQVEPVHRLMQIGFSSDDTAGVLQDLPAQLQRLLSSGSWQRFGVSILPNQGASQDESRLLISVLESHLELLPPPPGLPASKGAAAASDTPLSGRLLDPCRSPRVMITSPSGQVTELPIKVTGGSFAGALPCVQPGRYQVEVIGEYRMGPTVLANFPWLCGAPAGRAEEVAAATPAPVVTSRAWKDEDDAAQQAFGLLNADRIAARLQPLVLDPELSLIARKHCQDMAEHGFVAHVSPRTGGPSDRVKRAGIKSAMVSENLAQASSPHEAEQSLLNSPGHRANLLDKQPTHVGIGVVEVVNVAGQRQLLLTQLFIAKPVEQDLGAVKAELAQAVQKMRLDARRLPVTIDPLLTEVTNQIAQELASKPRDLRTFNQQSDKVVDQVMKRSHVMDGTKFQSLHASVAVISAAEQVQEVQGLTESAVTHVGLAVSKRTPTKDEDLPTLYLVVLMGRSARPSK